MFKIDAEFEIQHIKAESKDGIEWQVIFGFDGQMSPPITMTHEQLIIILQFNLHPDGEPLHHEMLRVLVEPLFDGMPRELWPIP